MSQGNSCSFKVPPFKQGINLQSKEKFFEFCKNAKGTNLFERYYPAMDYIQKAEEDGLWFEKRKLIGPPLTEVAVEEIPSKRVLKGLNFATNNYLGLANNPRTL